MPGMRPARSIQGTPGRPGLDGLPGAPGDPGRRGRENIQFYINLKTQNDVSCCINTATMYI